MNWYFEHFDEIFGLGRDYARDVRFLSDAGDIEHKSVMEIGSGTGNHVTALLDLSPEKVLATDISPVAVDKLIHRFGDDGRVTVRQCDGFENLFACETVTAFYCLVQRRSNGHSATDRLVRLLGRAHVGATWFEWMDTDAHNEANADRKPTTIAVGGDRISLSTTRAAAGTKIRYEGIVDGQAVLYEPVIERLPMITIESLASKWGASIEVHYLSESRRKALVRIS